MANFQIKDNKVYVVATIENISEISSQQIKEDIEASETAIKQLQQNVETQKANLELVEKLESELVVEKITVEKK